jgi:hypothetical protein
MNTRFLLPLAVATALLSACGPKAESPPPSDTTTPAPGAGDTATTPGGNSGDPSTTPPSTTTSPDTPTDTPPPSDTPAEPQPPPSGQ